MFLLVCGLCSYDFCLHSPAYVVAFCCWGWRHVAHEHEDLRAQRVQFFATDFGFESDVVYSSLWDVVGWI
jgi:hypothetical protein